MVGITGASGFVGKNLSAYLAARNLETAPITRMEIKSGDPSILSRFDTIIHLAGKAHDLKNASNEVDYIESNYELTKQLYDSFLKSSAKKFIFISSVKAVRDFFEGVLTEDIVPNPQTPYGKSKLMAEQYIQSKPLPGDKSFFILRPCMIHGPNNKGNLNLLYKFIKYGIPYPLAAFINKRSFLSIGNLCYVIARIIAADDLKSEVYHVADDQPLSTNEVIDILSLARGKKSAMWRISPRFIKFIARLGDHLKLPLNSARLEKLTESFVVGNAKVKEELDIVLPLSSREGLELTAKSFENA